MNFIITVIAVVLSSFSLAGPGGGHSHGHGHSHESTENISKEKTGEIGRTHVQRLIKAKKIDPSWINSRFDKSVVKKNEWLVTFVNEKGTKGKMLYIFLTKTGKFVAANFTGK